MSFVVSVLKIVIVSQRVASSEGATPAEQPITTAEWEQANAFADALRLRVPSTVAIEVLDRLKSHTDTLRLIIEYGILSTPTVLIFRSVELIAVWRYLPSTSEVQAVVN